MADLVTSLLDIFTWCTLVPVRNLGPLFSTTLALWFVTPAVTAIVLHRLVRVMTLVLPLRHPVPSILRGTFLCPSYPDSSLDPLTETAFISIGRRWLRYLPTRVIIVCSPVVLAPNIILGRLLCIIGPPAGTLIILRRQTRANLALLATVALATLDSPPHTWKKPRKATAVSAPSLCLTPIFLPVLTVRRRFLPHCCLNTTSLANLLITSIRLLPIIQLILCRTTFWVPTVRPTRRSRAIPLDLTRPLIPKQVLVPPMLDRARAVAWVPLLTTQLLLIALRLLPVLTLPTWKDPRAPVNRLVIPHSLAEWLFRLETTSGAWVLLTRTELILLMRVKRRLCRIPLL